MPNAPLNELKNSGSLARLFALASQPGLTYAQNFGCGAQNLAQTGLNRYKSNSPYKYLFLNDFIKMPDLAAIHPEP